MTVEEFLSALMEKGWQLTERQIEQFEVYYKLLVDWNKRINLTAITEKSAVYLKHFYDSLAPVLEGMIKDEPTKLLDIGAGAGFPSLPLKILCPQLQVTIIDSLQKRINFLEELTTELELTDVTLLHGRAEDFGQLTEYRGHFDWVTARAVARLNVLSELTLPFLKRGGQLLSFKALTFNEELVEAQSALRLLGGSLIRSINYQLTDGSTRYLAVIAKVKATPLKYPRKAGLPGKKPL